MAKISTYPIISIPTIDDLLIGTDVNDLNNTKNFTIGDIGNLIGQDYVPYVGATGNVNLGSFNITGGGFIVGGGTASQFLKADGSLDSTLYTPQTRTLTINGTTYNLSANRSWDLNTIDSLTTTGTSGAATYIGKVLNIPVYQAQGSYITQLSGEATGSGPGNAIVTLSNAAVISKVLTGLNVTGGTVVSTDTILQAFGKVQNQINGLTTGVTYQGVWNAATNTPFLQSSVGTQGYYYVVDVAGTTNLNGITDWQVGDWAIYNGTAWQKVDNTDAVVSVNGYVGAVVLTASDVGAVPTTRTLTINGVGYNLSADRAWTVGDVRTDGSYANPSWITSLGWSKITGTPTTLAGYGITDGALNTTTLTINGTTFDLTANRTWNVGTVTSVGTSGPLTGGTITGSGTIGITQAGASSDGYLSSTDWNTFNSKQGAISVNAPLTFVSGVIGITQSGASSDGYLSSTDWNTFNSKVSGSGTANTLPMWGSSSSLINSPLSYAADTFNFQYNSATGGTVNFTNSNGVAYAYTIQMNNFGSPRSTIHSYTDGLIIQSIGGTQVSRMFANGNLILGTGTVDNGYKLEVVGDLYVSTIANAIVDTDRFIVSDGGLIKYRTGAQILTDIGAVSSVGLTMPAAFTVSNSPITSSGTIAVSAAGTAAQYIRGDGTLADFPNTGGGGSSVSYYLNGSVNQGTFGGNTYYEMSKTPILGAGTDFSVSANGYVAQFITDAGDPNQLEIPAGNWNFETYFSASSGGGTPTFYVELYKYDGTTFTLIASNSSSPELIAFGTTINPYFSALAVPQTPLLATDRLAIRIYVNTSGRTITLHTEDNHLCQVITTFTTGLTALNGLTAQVQYFQTGTSGTDFNILSSVATHTFNLPTASAANRGALSSADWTTFNNKQNALTLTTTGTSGVATLIGSTLNIPDYGSALSGYVPTSRTLTINGVGLDLSTDRSWSVGTVTSVTASSPLASSGGTTPNITIQQASGSQNGFLSSTDWTTFNNKQNALTNPVTGTGTINTVPKFTGLTTIGNSAISDTDTEVNITKRVFITSGVHQFVFIPNLSSASNRIETIGGLPFQISTDGGSIGLNVGGGSSQFSMTNTSASFFIPVTSNGQASTSPAFIANNGVGASGTAQHYINFTAGTTTIARMLRGNGASGLVANGLNIDNFDGFGVRLNQLGGSGGSFNITGGNVGIGTTDPTSTFNARLAVRNEDAANNPTLVLFKNINSASSEDIFRVQSWNGAFNTVASIRANGSATFSSTLRATEITASMPSGNGALYINNSSLTNKNWTFIPQTSGGETDLLLFYTGASAGTRLTVTNSGNVGIGTSTPTPFLNANARTLAIDSSGTNPAELAITGQNANVYLGNGGLAAYLYSTGSYPLIFGTNGAERMRITSSGNLLVGTTSDNGARLQVSGSATIVGPALPMAIASTNATELYCEYRYNTSTVVGYIGNGTGLMTGGGDANFGIRAQNSLVFSTLTNERMRITSGGNVLIGTTTDNGARLQVSGGATFSGFVEASTSSSSIYDFGIRNTGTGNTRLRIGNATSSARLTITLGAAASEFARIGPEGPFPLHLQTNGVDRLSIDGSTGAATFSSSITSTLSSGIFLNNSSGGTNATQIRINNTSGDLRLGIESSTGGTIQIGTLPYAAVFGNQANNPVQFTTNGTAQMTITSGGNVGIGTSSPTNLTGYTTLSINNSTFGSIFEVMYGGTPYGRFFANTNTSVVLTAITSIPLVFATNDTERMRITSNGKVLIGTTSNDGAMLQVAGTGGSFGDTVQFYNTSTNGAFKNTVNIGDDRLATWGLILGKSGINTPNSGYHAPNGAHIVNVQNGPIRFGTNNTERMEITSSGNVLIGTTTDSGERLQVRNGMILAELASGSNGAIIKMGRSAGAYYWSLGIDSSASDFNFYNNSGTSVARITTSGTLISATGVYDTTSATNHWIARVRGNDRIIADNTGYVYMPFLTTGSGIDDLGWWGASGGSWTYNGMLMRISSSARYKKNIRDIEIDTSKIYDLRTISYENNEFTAVDGLTSFGLLAEDVAEKIPLLATFNNEGQPEGVQYKMLSVLLLEELKKLKQEIDTLKNA